MAFAAGTKLRASALNNLPYAASVGGWAANGSSNILSTGSATSETDLGTRARSANISFQAGHLYIATLGLTGNASGGTPAIWVFNLRVVAPVGGGGSVLFGGSGSVSKLEFYAQVGGDDWSQTQQFHFVPASSFVSPVYTSYNRANGSGTMNLYGNAGCSCVVNDYGANSGIAIT